MKKILALLLAFAMLAALSACGNDADISADPVDEITESTAADVPTETEAESVSETASEAESTAAAETGEYEKIYKDTLDSYPADRVAAAADLGYEFNESDYSVLYYCIKDINSDGVPELIVSEDGDDECALYTVINGESENVFFPERHGSYSITADGYIGFEYKGMTVYKMNGSELEELFFVDMIEDEDAFEDECDKLKAQNGVSTEDADFNFIKYTAGSGSELVKAS